MSSEEFTNAYTAGFSVTRRFLLSRGMPQSQAEELAQAAWTKAWERRSQLRELASVSAWVNTIALNLFRGELRKSVIRVELQEMDAPVRSSTENRIDAAMSMALLKKLDHRLMVLHVVAGLTSKEIAAKCSLSAVAVRVRLHRAKLEIRRRLGGSDGPAAPKSCGPRQLGWV